ncbi:putative porin [Phocaeicola sp.]
MKRIFSIIFLLFLCSQLTLQAQLTNDALNNGYGSSSSGLTQGQRDRNGNPIDTTAVVDANTIPIGLYSWKVDSRFGNITYLPIDTLTHAFQNTNDVGGMDGQYNYLGNLGSPRLSRIFFERRDPSQYFFTDPYDFSVQRPEDVVFTNTLSPFTNLSYYKGGGNRYGEERFKSYFAINANKRLGFGFYIDYIYGRGMYDSQSTALFNGGLFSSYRGDKYDMHFIFNNDNLKMAENGGITDDRYITNPLDMAEGKKEYNSYDIPTNLTKIWNHNTSYHAFLTHKYNLGFYRERVDSTMADSIKIRRDFVPVTSFIHTLQVDLNNRKYISYDDAQNREYFRNNYLGTDSIDKTSRTSIKNTIGISLREGFNKWAKAGLTAFLSYEYRNFTLTDTVDVTGARRLAHYKESVVSIGGELSKKQGKLLHYNVLGEIALAGEDAGQFTVEGNGDLNVRLFGDTVRLEANAFIKNQNPVFYFRHFHSKHYWWNNDDLSKIMRTRVEGKLSIDKWGTTLRAGAENIKNYTYLANTSEPVKNEEGVITSFKNNAAVRQYSGNIQVLSAILQQKLKFGILHLEGEVAYQKSSEQDILPLPEFSMYGNLYIRAGLAKKVLQVELGADVRYFTKYYAPDYSPAIGQFYNQNPEDRIEIGSYPIVNVYANLHLKRTRFFIMMYHINQGSGSANSFLAPHYPVNPQMIKFGLSWNFFD